MSLTMHQWARLLEIGFAYRFGRPVCERADQPRRVIADVLWESTSAHDEYIGYRPSLEVAVNCARRRILTHRRTSGVVRCLVHLSIVVVAHFLGRHFDGLRADRFRNFRCLAGDV